MKHIITLLFLAATLSILSGIFLNVAYSEKLIGFGVLGLFFIVFPLFSYYRWKDKNVQDYMLTKDNIEKMKKAQRYKKE